MTNNIFNKYYLTKQQLFYFIEIVTTDHNLLVALRFHKCDMEFMVHE